MSRFLFAIVIVLSVGCGADPKPPPRLDYLHEAAKQGKRIEPWSQEHSDWLGSHCDVTQSGGGQYSMTLPQVVPGNVVLVAGFNENGRALFVAYECASMPPWPAVVVREPR